MLFLALLLFGCSAPLTRADFSRDLREVVSSGSAWSKDYKNRDLLEQANQKAIEVRDKYRGSEVATKECKSEFQSLSLLSTGLMLAKSSPDPSQAPPSSPSSALDLTNSCLSLLGTSNLLASPSPQATP